MTELELYKFCQDNEIDWRGSKLILWIPFWKLDDFTKMVGYNYFSEGDIEVGLLYDCIAIELNDLCDCFGIDPENILRKED